MAPLNSSVVYHPPRAITPTGVPAAPLTSNPTHKFEERNAIANETLAAYNSTLLARGLPINDTSLAANTTAVKRSVPSHSQPLNHTVHGREFQTSNMTFLPVKRTVQDHEPINNLTLRSVKSVMQGEDHRASNLTMRSVNSTVHARSVDLSNTTVPRSVGSLDSPYVNSTKHTHTRSVVNLSNTTVPRSVGPLDSPYVNSTLHRRSVDLSNMTVPRSVGPLDSPYVNSTMHDRSVDLSNVTIARSSSSPLTNSSSPEESLKQVLHLRSFDASNITARAANDTGVVSGGPMHIAARSENSTVTKRSWTTAVAIATADEDSVPSSNLTVRSFNSTTRSLPSGHASLARDAPTPHRLLPRTTGSQIACTGCLDPNKINNHVYFALFAILGAGLVAGAIWFFFWAKHGGFEYREGDWEDYKSTVLRRKGPDGKTLSNATKSTRLGGGSVVPQYERLAALSVVGYDKKGRKGILAQRGWGGSHSVYYSDDFTKYDGGSRKGKEEMTEVATQPDYDVNHQTNDHHSRRYHDHDIREYKHEKPARVGGMNRPADGSNYDYSDLNSDSMTQITESTNRSTANLLRDNEEREERKRQKAERKTRDEAARMERKWRKEAEAAARALAREQRESSPSAQPMIPPQQAPRSHHRRESSSSSPQKKRDYSFSRGQDDISTTQSGTSGTRSASYYDAYRPREERSASRSRHNSPEKKGYKRSTYAESEAATSDSGTRIYEHRLDRGPAKEKKPARGGRDVMAGYRRNMGGESDDDNDF